MPFTLLVGSAPKIVRGNEIFPLIGASRISGVPGTAKHNEFVLKFWHDPYELTLFPDGRAIIKGTTDPAIARSLYARYVGA